MKTNEQIMHVTAFMLKCYMEHEKKGNAEQAQGFLTTATALAWVIDMPQGAFIDKLIEDVVDELMQCNCADHMFETENLDN